MTQHNYGNEASGRACGVEALQGQLDRATAESMSAALRRAEQERDWANDELAVRKSQLQAARYELSAEISAFKRMRDERDLARAELASARQELDAVRTARDNLDRQLGEARKHCAECRQAS